MNNPSTAGYRDSIYFNLYYLEMLPYNTNMRIESIEELKSPEPKHELSDVAPCDFGWKIHLLPDIESEAQ